MPETYPCEKCGKPRTKAEGGTVFTVCDECWDAPQEVKTMVVSWRVEHYRVKGLEVFPAFDSHIYDPVVMLQCTHCLKAYGAENIATIPRHRESLEVEIKVLKAERDEWRDKAGLHQIASAAHKRRADRLESELAEMREWTGVRYRVNTMCRQGHEMVLYVSEDWSHKCPACSLRADKERLGGADRRRTRHIP